MRGDKACFRDEKCSKRYCDSPSNPFVEDQEELIRILFLPDHFDKEGEVSIAAIPAKDLLHEGLSVDRKKGLVASKYQRILEKIKSGATFQSVAMTSAGKVRNVGKGDLFICPSGSKRRRSHSSIYLKLTDIDERELYYLREELREV
ncbi:MAG: hypothetical protein ACOZBL_01075, partial [Patescibacteria group bacterium]